MKPFAYCRIKYQAPPLIIDNSIDMFFICDGIRLYWKLPQTSSN